MRSRSCVPLGVGEVAALHDRHSESECLHEEPAPLDGLGAHAKRERHRLVRGGNATASVRIRREPVRTRDSEQRARGDASRTTGLLTTRSGQGIHQRVEPRGAARPRRDDRVGACRRLERPRPAAFSGRPLRGLL